MIGYLPFLSLWDEKYPHKGMEKMARVYGAVTGMFLGPSPPIVSVCGHDAVKEALMNDDLNGRPVSQISQARTFGEQLGKYFTLHLIQ